MTMLTILDLAKSFGAKGDENGNVSAGEIYKAGFDMIGGCQDCGATIAAYNAYPSRTGYWKCGDCIGEHGFKTVQEFVKHLNSEINKESKTDERP